MVVSYHLSSIRTFERHNFFNLSASFDLLCGVIIAKDIFGSSIFRFLMDSIYFEFLKAILCCSFIVFDHEYLSKRYPLSSVPLPLRYTIFLPLLCLRYLESTILPDQPQMKNKNKFQRNLDEPGLLSLLLSKLCNIVVLPLRLFGRIIFGTRQSRVPSPVVNTFQMMLDDHFNPGEVQRHVVDGYILIFKILGKQDLKTDDVICFTLYECTGYYMLPTSANVETTEALWPLDGILIVKAIDAAQNNKCTTRRCQLLNFSTEGSLYYS